MNTLVKYEFLKILRRRSTVLTLLASLIITAFLFALPVLQFQTYNANGVIKGLDGIAYEKTQRVQEVLTDEIATQSIREVSALFDNPDNVGFDGTDSFLIGDAYWNGVAPREEFLDLIASAYVAPNAYAGYDSLPKVDIEHEPSFYKARNEKIEAMIQSPSYAMTQNQTEFWRSLNSRTKTPLIYGYHEAWTTILSSFELLTFAMLAVCITIAPIFSGEYQAGTDAVILCSKYGKSKLVTAKIVASNLFGILAFTLHVVVAFGIPLLFFGTDGWNLPVQLAGLTIPYPLTFLKMTIQALGVVYLVLFGMLALTLFLSAKMKSPYLVLTVLVPVLFLPLFLSPNGITGLYNKLLFLTPYRAVIPEIGKYISYQFGSLVMDAFAVRAVFYIVLVALLLPVAGRGFKRHQVSA